MTRRERGATMPRMGAVVAVEVAPPPESARELAALLEACSAALPDGKCQRPEDITAPDSATAAAWVSWLDSSTVHIEVKLSGSEPRTLTREFTFGEDDAPIQRVRTVGLTIATIVDELEVRTAEASVQSDASRPAEPSEPGVEPAQAPDDRAAAPPSTIRPLPAEHQARPTNRSEPQNALEVNGRFGTGLASGALRIGLVGRVLHDVDVLPLFADMEVGYSLLVSAREPQVSWNEFALGGGVRTYLSRFRGELGVRAVLERTAASAKDPVSGVEDSQDTWLPGFGIGACASWPSEGPLALTLGARASFLLREIRVTNAGVAQARVPSHSVSVAGGVRLIF